jgi:hypothetical protein
MKRTSLVLSLALTAALFSALAAEDRKPAPKAPDVLGKWTGTWGVQQDPGKPPSPYAGVKMKLDCNVEMKDGKWQATFEGDCGRPYRYTIKMLGRQAGNAILFQGTADLGPMDGGVYDWIGRANEKEFIGFYTSAGHVGTFTLARPKTQAPAQ